MGVLCPHLRRRLDAAAGLGRARWTLTPLLLHTSVNVLPDLGFSNYEQALTGLFAINVVSAIVMTFALAGKPDWPADAEPAPEDGR